MKINARSIKAGLGALLRSRGVNAPPLHLHIEPTNYCNYDCLMCYHKSAIAKPAHLPLNMFELIIDEARPWYVSLNGYGEPLMCPHFFDMVRLLTRRGIRCNTTTNGSLLHNYYDEFLQSGIEQVSVSLDAASAAVYAAVRRKDNFDAIVAAMSELVRRRGAAKTPIVRASFVIQKSSLDELLPFVRLMKDAGVDGALFQPYIELDRGASGAGATADGIDETQLKRLLREAAEQARAIGLNSNLDAVLARIDDYLRVQYRRETDPKLMRRCVKPWVSIFISADGDVRPCCSFASIPTGTGNAFEHGLMRALNDPAMGEFRDKLRRGASPHWLCARCVPMSLMETITGASN